MTIKDKLIVTQTNAKKIGLYSFNILAITFVFHLFFGIKFILYGVIAIVFLANFMVGTWTILCPNCKTNLLKVKEKLGELNYCPKCSLDINKKETGKVYPAGHD